MWQPPVELSAAEEQILKRVKRAKLFVFLRRHRHQIFTPEFQAELAGIYKDSPKGFSPVEPAMLALALILQAYTGVSDDEVIEATLMDRRWQLALDCLDTQESPFSKGTLVAFRTRLIEHQMDRRLLERTVEIAAASKAFGARNLRAALDSSPLWGAGRVEDTYNLLGHALRKALSVIAREQGRELAAIAEEVNAELVCGSSLKAALDLDWDDPEARAQALQQVIGVLDRVEQWLPAQEQPMPEDSEIAPCIEAARRIRQQDVATTADGALTLIKGVAKDRRISVEDAEMRHGRKSRSVRVDGYKRHVCRDLDSELIVAVGITPANAAEASVADSIRSDLKSQKITLKELHIDRAYLSSALVSERDLELEIFCKAWPVRAGSFFPKTAFAINWERQMLRCPQGIEMTCQPGKVVHFPRETCASCPQQARCTGSKKGRSVSLHQDEKLLRELRVRQGTSEGRATLRERVGVEHDLSHIGHWQGDRARYRGARKNLFDLRRCAVVNNLHIFARRPEMLAQAA
jgi:DDE family transposase/transposase-like protein DUF772